MTSSMTACGADRPRAAQGPEAAAGAVVVERRRVDDADPGEQAKARLGRPGAPRPQPAESCQRGRRRTCASAMAALGQARRTPTASTGAATCGHGALSGDREHRGGRSIAQAEARRAQPGRLAVRRRRPGRSERPLEVAAAPRRRRAGRRCRRRRGPRSAAAASSRTARRTWRPRRPRPAATLSRRQT